MTVIENVLAYVYAKTIARLTEEMVDIPSHVGDLTRTAEVFACVACDLGMRDRAARGASQPDCRDSYCG